MIDDASVLLPTCILFSKYPRGPPGRVAPEGMRYSGGGEVTWKRGISSRSHREHA